MRVVTTVHKAGFEQYGHRWLQSIENWPSAEFAMYCEGFSLGHACATDIGKIERLAKFKHTHAAYKAPSWRHDIVRFSNKVFAAYDALYDYDGIGVWLDADCVTFERIPDGYIEEQLGGAYMALFKRTGHYTETGLWIVDCSHPEHKAVLDTWLQWFEKGTFRQLSEWHDCTTLDATLRLFERDGRVKTRSLSGAFEGEMNPLAKSDIGRFVMHMKGARKGLEFDPDNANARAFFGGAT